MPWIHVTVTGLCSFSNRNQQACVLLEWRQVGLTGFFQENGPRGIQVQVPLPLRNFLGYKPVMAVLRFYLTWGQRIAWLLAFFIAIFYEAIIVPNDHMSLNV